MLQKIGSVLTLVWCFADPQIAAGEITVTFSPAIIESGPRSLPNLLEFPARKTTADFSVIVACQTEIKITGETAHSFCFTRESRSGKYRQATAKALRKATFVPASINDNPVKVYVSFRVVFTCLDGECVIIPLMNLGQNEQQFGYEYIAPQEILEEQFWYSKFKKFARLEHLGVAMPYRGVVFRFSISVDEHGNGTDPKVEYKGRLKSNEINAALTAISKARFIPGFFEGKPTRMRYFEIIYANPKDYVGR